MKGYELTNFPLNQTLISTRISKPQEVIWRSRLCTDPMVWGESPWAKASSGDSSDFEILWELWEITKGLKIVVWMHLISHSFVVAINVTLLLTSIVFFLEICPAFCSQKLHFSSSLMPFSHLYVPHSHEISILDTSIFDNNHFFIRLPFYRSQCIGNLKCHRKMSRPK